jgi:transcription antitermination factor NusG
MFGKVVQNGSKLGRDSLSEAAFGATTGNEIKSSAEPSDWYAIQTRYRCEKKVGVALERKGIVAFIPLLQEIHRWSDRKQKVEVPLFSGYAFAQVELSANLRRTVLQTEGVIAFVGAGDELTPVPPRQIEDLRRLLRQKLPCALSPFLTTGQRVRIRGGCLDGLEGLLQKNDAKRLVISIESIQRAVAVQIEGYELELI